MNGKCERKEMLKTILTLNDMFICVKLNKMKNQRLMKISKKITYILQIHLYTLSNNTIKRIKRKNQNQCLVIKQ